MAEANQTSPFVLARVSVKPNGFPVYAFSDNPYVHRTESGAIQEAQKLARSLNCDIAVFKRVMVVEIEKTVPVEAAPVVTPEQLAHALKNALRDFGFNGVNAHKIAKYTVNRLDNARTPATDTTN